MGVARVSGGSFGGGQYGETALGVGLNVVGYARYFDAATMQACLNGL